MRPRAINILYVEDDEGDFHLFVEMMKQMKIKNRVFRSTTGEDALRLLRREEKYKTYPIMDLVVMDAQLPGMSGIEVLREMKKVFLENMIRHIPVVFLSGTNNPDVEMEAYRLNIKGFFRKPFEPDVFEQIVRTLDGFYYCVVEMKRA
jgi:CheY-like chemotaxis protein